MESSHQESEVVNHEYENNVMLYLERATWMIFESSFSILLTLVHFSLLPAILIYSFWAHAIDQTWRIIKHVSSEIFELMKIVPLTIELWFWSALIFLQVVFFFKKVEEATVEVEKKVYGKSKVILRKLNVFPLSTKNAAALYSFMMRIPFFGKGRLPFPNFLFEDTFAKIQFRKGVISMTVSPPSDTPQLGAETSASAQPSTSVLAPAIPETIPEDTSETTSDDVSETTPKDIPKTTPEDIPKTTPEDIPKTTPEDIPKTTPEDILKTTPETATVDRKSPTATTANEKLNLNDRSSVQGPSESDVKSSRTVV